MSQSDDRNSFDSHMPIPSPNSSRNEFSESTPLVTSSKSHFSNGSVNVFLRSGKQLRKSLGFRHAFAYVVSILFGSGIFISPSLVARQTSNMGMAIVTWVLAGVPSLLGALCFCELACMYKKTGSYYLYIYEAYGAVVGFMVIWMEVIIVIPAAFSVLSVAIGENIVGPYYDIESSTGIWLVKSTAVLFMIFSVIINSISSWFVGKSQIFFSLFQTITVVFLIVLGVYQVALGHVENYVIMFNNSSNFDIGSFGVALYNGLWAYDGWGAASAISEELTNLKRDLFLAFVTGIPVVILCSLLVNLALMSALTRSEIMASSTVATSFVAKVLGRRTSLIMPVAVAISCFGSIVASMFVVSRVILSAAREGQLPYTLSYIHKDRRTPIPALCFVLFMSIIWMLPAANGLQTLVMYFSFAVWLKYGLAIFSVVIMRKRKPDLPRPYKVWLVNPIVTSLIALFLVIIPFWTRPVEAGVSLTLFLTGLPIYYVCIKKHEMLPSCIQTATDAVNSFLQRKCNLVPCVFLEEAESTKENDQKL